MPKILIVDDDIDLCRRLHDWLLSEQHDVELAYNKADALQLLTNFKYELILLDWELPDGTGVELCKEYRKDGGQTPIIFLTGKGTLSEKEAGLDSGADDYVVKPFEIRELAARIRSIMRRPFGLTPQALVFFELELDVDSRMLTRGNEKLRLMPRECKLLEFLMRHPNKHYTSKVLLNSVWPSDIEASEETVRTCMKTLRQKLVRLGVGDMVKTVLKTGYIMETPNSN